jgi:hypothetical protein
MISGGRNNRGYLLKRKHMLIKVNVPGGEHVVGDRIVASIALGVGRVADEDACNTSWCKFMWRSGGSARITQTPEDTQTIIRRWHTKEKVVRCVVPLRVTGPEVKEQ